MAVIVDNLARTQAAANASKPKPKAVKVESEITFVITNDLCYRHGLLWRMTVMER